MRSVTISRHRRDDHSTSIQGARDVAGRAPTQAMRLLKEYTATTMGYTDEEAAQAAALLDSCYWKRCGELRQEGYIVPVEILGQQLTRKGRAGTQRLVCTITDAGVRLLKNKGLL